MPSVFESSTRSTLLALAAAATVAATVTTAWPILRSRRKSRQTDVCDYAELWKKTPRTLLGWRAPGESLLDGIALWELLRTPFLEAGIDLWCHDKICVQSARREHVMLQSGFGYATRVRGEEWIQWLRIYSQRNVMTWMGTTREGHNVAIRIMCVGDEGKEQMQILRKIARGNVSLFSDNHVVPLWGEVAIGDLTFAICPFVGYNMGQCYGYWAKDSVGDLMDMIMQALEALAFIHERGIAHRDAAKDNFLVQWHPESLTTMQVPICRPRVFMIDLELAHEFPPDTPEESRLLTGPPWEDYLRKTAPEVALGPYDPFKADVWQLADSFSDFRSTVEEIDAVLDALHSDDPACRPTAREGRDRLATIVHGLPPVSLLIPPTIVRT